MPRIKKAIREDDARGLSEGSVERVPVGPRTHTPVLIAIGSERGQ